MATKLPGWCGKLTAVVFTSIVAPVLVNLAVRETPDKASKPEWDEPVAVQQLETPPSTYSTSSFPTLSHNGQSLSHYHDAFADSQPVQTVRIIVRGVGRTPELALQDALHRALRQASASMVDARSWARNCSALCAGILRDSDGLILGWQDLGVRKEWRGKELVYHNEAAVEVNLTALANRLRAIYSTDWSNPSQTTQYQPSLPRPRI